MPISLIPTDLSDSVDVRFASITTPLISANSFTELVSAYSELYKSNIPVAPFVWMSWTSLFSSFLVRKKDDIKMSFYFKLTYQDVQFRERLQDQALASLLLALIKAVYVEGKQQDSFDAHNWKFDVGFDVKFKPTLTLMDKTFPIPSFPSLKLLIFIKSVFESINEHFRLSQQLDNNPNQYSHLTDLITGTSTSQTGIWNPHYRAKLNEKNPYSFTYYWIAPPAPPKPELVEIKTARKG